MYCKEYCQFQDQVPISIIGENEESRKGRLDIIECKSN